MERETSPVSHRPLCWGGASVRPQAWLDQSAARRLNVRMLCSVRFRCPRSTRLTKVCNRRCHPSAPAVASRTLTPTQLVQVLPPECWHQTDLPWLAAPPLDRDVSTLLTSFPPFEREVIRSATNHHSLQLLFQQLMSPLPRHMASPAFLQPHESTPHPLLHEPGRHRQMRARFVAVGVVKRNIRNRRLRNALATRGSTPAEGPGDLRRYTLSVALGRPSKIFVTLIELHPNIGCRPASHYDRSGGLALRSSGMRGGAATGFTFPNYATFGSPHSHRKTEAEPR